MAAMPFPSNDILLIQGNLPRVILVLTLNNASFLFPYFDLLFSSHFVFTHLSRLVVAVFVVENDDNNNNNVARLNLFH